MRHEVTQSAAGQDTGALHGRCIREVIANEAATLPAGSAIVVDDCHNALLAIPGIMINLVERWLAFLRGEARHGGSREAFGIACGSG